MSNSTLVNNLFNDLSTRYDFLNDLFSFGLHRFWKRKLLNHLQPICGEVWVDLCCGTGDLTFPLAKLVKPHGKVIGIDAACQPLYLAEKRLIKETELSIEWINKDVLDEDLMFEYFDGAVMAYGLRNLSDPLKGLKAIRRFLKPGGRAGVLDFNKTSNNSISGLFQKLYLNFLVVPIASRFGFKNHFKYLVDSIQNFPDGVSLENLAIKAGFLEAKYYKIAGNQMGILLLKN